MWVSLISSFNEHLIKKQTWIPNFGSVATVIGLVMLDIIVPLYHSVMTDMTLRPSYDGYIIFAIYIFLPLPENLHSVILALATTFSYLLVTFVMTYRQDDHAAIKVINKSRWNSTDSFWFSFSFADRFRNLFNFVFVFVFSLCQSDSYRFGVFAWCQFLRRLCAFTEWGGNPKGISWPQRMCRREFAVAVRSWSRSLWIMFFLLLLLHSLIGLLVSAHDIRFNACDAFIWNWYFTVFMFAVMTFRYMFIWLFSFSFQIRLQKNLLLSILPAHTASVLEKAIRGMIEKIRQEKNESTQELNAKR